MSVPSPAERFEHVSLGFDDQVVLRDIIFAVPTGSALVIVGGAEWASHCS